MSAFDIDRVGHDLNNELILLGEQFRRIPEVEDDKMRAK